MKNWKQLSFRLNGHVVQPDSVSSITPQLEEMDDESGSYFHCTGLNLRVLINGVEKLYKADFIVKVIPVLGKESIKPGEKIEEIRDNLVVLRE